MNADENKFEPPRKEFDGPASPVCCSVVSVIIPAYNAEATIARAIDSALAQDYSPLEIIVVDDGSADGTTAVINRFADRSVRLVRMVANAGASACRNAGIRAATGQYLAFLDADDEWLPSKISRQLAAFEACTECSLVTCDGDLITPEGATVETLLGGLPVRPVEEAWRILLAESFIHTSCVLTRRDLVLQLGGFDQTLVVAEDWDLWIRLALAGRVAYVDDSLVRVHVTPESLMKRQAANARDYLLPMIKRHLRENGAQLTKTEQRRIWAVQLERIGRTTCQYGDWLAGARLLVRAVIAGRSPLRAVRLSFTTSPLVRALRRLRQPGREGGRAKAVK